MYENFPKYNPKTKKFEKTIQNDISSDSKKNTISSNSDTENIESQISKKQETEKTEINTINKTPSNPIKISIFDKETNLPLYPIYEIFSEKFPDFICGICLSFVTNPLECSTCSTIFCRRCIFDYTLYSNHCPNRCKNEFKSVNRILKNMINSVQVNCIFFHKGCKEMLNYENYDKHIENCIYGPSICDRCNFVDTNDKVINHCKVCFNYDKNYYDGSRIRCKYCNVTYGNDSNEFIDVDKIKINIMKLIIHEYLCNEQMMNCNFCERKFRLLDFRKHIINNKCQIYQLENKVEFLNQKIQYYESEIRERDISSGKSHSSKIFKFINKFDVQNYSLNKNNDTNFIKNDEINNELNELKQNKIKEQNEKIEKENLNLNLKGKIYKMRLSQKSLYNKSSRITSMSFINETNSDIKDLLISFSNGYEIEIDKITTNNNKSSLYQKINLKEIPNTLSKNRFNKLNEIKITHILQTKLNKSDIINDIFLITDAPYYFLYNNDLTTLKKLGKPSNTPITICINIIIKDEVFIALGTIGSNVIIFDPYENKSILILNHSKKRIITMSYIEEGNILITSSGKENAFYIWKYEENENENNDESDWNFVLKNTLKEHNSWVWSLTYGKILNKDYIISGGADKRIIIWKLYKGECGTKNLLSIKEHNDSIIVIKFLIKNDTNLIFTGSFDGVIKIFCLDVINLNDNFNDENITFNYRCVLTIFNKDSQISDILIFEKNNEENNNKIGMIVNCEAYDGYSINEIEYEIA